MLTRRSLNVTAGGLGAVKETVAAEGMITTMEGTVA